MVFLCILQPLYSLESQRPLLDPLHPVASQGKSRRITGERFLWTSSGNGSYNTLSRSQSNGPTSPMAKEAGKYSLLLCPGGREKENYKCLAIYAIEMEKQC